MPIPVAQAAGAVVAATSGNALPAWPAHLAFDIALCINETCRETVVFSSPQGFAQVPGFPIGTGTAGTAAATAIDAWWCRATGSAMPAPTIVVPSDHIITRIVTFRGCVGTGNPWDATPSGDVTGSTATISVPGGTTTLANALIVVLAAFQLDSGANRVVGGSWANVDLATPAISEFTSAQTTPNGNGGSWNLATGGKAVAGVYGASTATATGGTAMVQAHATIQLKGFVDPGAGGTILPGRLYG